MHIRASALIETLRLVPHPEGGHYREVFRSAAEVVPADGRPSRSALTTITFLLAEGERSRWHRVASDEVWHLLEGDPLDLFVSSDSFTTVETARLGRVGEGAGPVHVVPAGAWQAARTTGAYSLVGCTVGPGFDFSDFELLDRDSALADSARRHPEAESFV